MESVALLDGPLAVSSSDVASRDEWIAWNEPRECEDGFETPYHHMLVEIRISGEAETRAINPLDVRSHAHPRSVVWRPMPWAMRGYGNRQWFGELQPESVFEGLDGHLFHTINGACEQILEGVGMTDRGCQEWLTVLRARQSWCEARGIEYRMLVIPEHHALYPDKIPGRPAASSTRPIMRILRAAEPRLRSAIVYPCERMLAGRSQHEVSYPHDVHFTRYGAFLCYLALMQSLPDVTPDRVVTEDDLTGRTIFVAGDVARAYGSPGKSVEWFDPPPVPSKTIVKLNPMTSNQVDVFETGQRDLPTLVMSRTSNSTQLFPFLLRHFSRLAAVSGTRMFMDLIESEAPQVVITEIPERFLAGRRPHFQGEQDLTAVPVDGGPGEFESVIGHPLPLARGRDVT